MKVFMKTYKPNRESLQMDITNLNQVECNQRIRFVLYSPAWISHKAVDIEADWRFEWVVQPDSQLSPVRP